MGGEILVNPITTERVEVLVSPEESGGECLKARFSLQPHGGVAGTHYHPNQVQTLEVESGTLSVRVGSNEFSLTAGETATVSAGVAHDQWNESDGVVTPSRNFAPH
jgi:quercetin dioxygenase-like cupin family protein